MVLKNLQQIYEANPESDKGTVHSYISYYEESLKLYRHTAEKVLEIGVLDGGSTRLWKNYFDKAFIVGIDISEHQQKEEDRITYIKGDGYEFQYLDLFFDEEFDVIIDDGPHTLKSQLYFILHWYSKLKPGGLMVVEDIQSDSDAVRLITLAQEKGYQAKLIDLRHVKGRYDDLILEIKKPMQCPE